jgi:hypothetical protein
VRSLITSMVFYVFYIASLGLLTFRSRVRAVKSGRVPLAYFKLFDGKLPEDVAVLGRHFNNQFELPPLFLILCVTHLALKEVSNFTIICSWSFISSRLVHSYVHLRSNHIGYRFTAFFTGMFFILCLAAELLFSNLA